MKKEKKNVKKQVTLLFTFIFLVSILFMSKCYVIIFSDKFV